MTRSRDLANLGDNTSKLEQQGLVKIIPSSVAVGSGSGSVSAVGTVTFSGASSVSLNGCFSSTYQNYLMVFDTTAFSADNVDVSLRLRASGTDTNTNYVTQRLYGYNTTVAADLNAIGTDEFILASADKDYNGFTNGNVTFYRPQLASVTGIVATCEGYYGTILNTTMNNGGQNSNTQFDGVTMIISTGTATGTIQVYGFN